MTVRYLERLAHAVAVGVRLRDVVTGDVVGSDVSVRVVSTHSRRSTTATLTPSGVFTAHRVSGLRAWELRGVVDGVDEVVDVLPGLFRVEIRDCSAGSTPSRSTPISRSTGS